MINKGGRETCWRKLRAEMELLGVPEDVTKDKVDGSKPKRRLLDIDASDEESDDEMDELTRFVKFYKWQIQYLIAVTTGTKMSLPWMQKRTLWTGGEKRRTSTQP